MSLEERDERELDMLLVMALVELYWNGNKFGP